MSAGYDKLKAAVDKDCVKDGGTMHPEGCVACGGKCSHKYCDKFKWVIDRAKAYGEATGEMKFRCPSCGKESPNPYECKACGWKVYGLLGDMGKGVFVYVKEQLRGETMFIPISWEEDKV